MGENTMTPIMMAAAMAATAVPAAPAKDHTIVYSDIPRSKAAQEKYGWADSVTAGGTVYVSGIIAYTLPTDKSLEDAYTRAFDRLTGVLERAGVSWADVVEVRSFHTDPTAQLDAIAAVKRRYRAAPDPAWTAVGTSALLAPNGITEIALIAHKPRAK
jgi:enamine deaminase RidA (YjgF/YER057c/UK114 family)